MQIEHGPLGRLSKNASFLSKLTILLLTEADQKKGRWLAQLPGAVRERVEGSLARLQEPLKAGGRHCVPGRAKGEEDLLIALYPSESDVFHLLEFSRDTLKEALQPHETAIRIVLLSDTLANEAADAFGASLATRVFPMPVFGKREKDQKPFKLQNVELVSSSRKHLELFKQGFASGEGTNIARYLATLPPNVLDPKAYGERIRQLCKESKISVRFHSKEELKKMGAGAFTAVDQGNPDSQGGIYELTYAPAKKPRRTIHLVGKGLCFDTGGYDVKVGGGMLTMKGDMGGSAVALGLLVTAAKLGLPYKMKAFLAVTENHLSPKAYKADEVVTALNGLTIEVVNTDAEGRMVLADTLTLASKEKPDYVIDFATLTGSAIRSIGTKMAAGFTNRDKLHDRIKEAGRLSGERIWTFPIDSTYAKALESKVADTLQCCKGPGTDHIYAACFLSKFVADGVPWVHVDLSPAENEGGLGHVDSFFTGFGVRWGLEFLKKA